MSEPIQGGPVSRVLYVLDDHDQPIGVDDPEQWWQWVKDHHEEMVLRRDIVLASDKSRIAIVTAFIGVDSGYTRVPQLFETAVIADDDLTVPFRYRSRDEAIRGHEKVVVAMNWDGP